MLAAALASLKKRSTIVRSPDIVGRSCLMAARRPSRTSTPT